MLYSMHHSSSTSWCGHCKALWLNLKPVWRLGELLCTHNIGDLIEMVSRAGSIVTHDKADVSLISYMLDAARYGTKTVHILSDDTDVFVLIVYWCWKVGITSHLQMQRRDGTVLNISSTVENLGEHCCSILAMHAISGCDTTSYSIGKGKVSTLIYRCPSTGAALESCRPP